MSEIKTREELQAEALRRGYGYNMLKIAMEGCDSIFTEYDTDLKKHKMTINIRPSNDKKDGPDEQEDEGLSCQVSYHGERVLSMTDDYVWVYIPGDWEDILIKKYKNGLRKNKN